MHPEYPEDGTVSDVTDWIGDDPVRAGIALAAERERESPRKGVLDHAEKLATPAEEDGGATEVTFRHVRDGRSRTMPVDAASVATYERHPNWERVA